MTDPILDPSENPFKENLIVRTDDTEYPCLEYDPTKKTLIVLIGGSGSGKDTIMDAILEQGNAIHVQTATSRNIRKGEDPNKYLWMRKQREGEDFEEYKKNLLREYDLVEQDPHDGSVYGLPRVNIEKALANIEDTRFPILRMEIKGAKRVQEIFGEDYNVVVIGIKPEDEKEFETAIRTRQQDDPLPEEEIRTRVIEASQKQKLNDSFAHFTIVNSRKPGGLERSVNSLAYLLRTLAGTN